MTSAAAKILLLEDDRNLGLVICEHLKMNGFDVVLCRNGKEGLREYRNQSFDLCLVDIMMPELDGFSFARQIRESGDEIPLIFLTAKSLQEDKIEGFKIGCDDYITKPFSVQELLLRIQAVLKRIIGGNLSSSRCEFDIGFYKFNSKTQTLAGPDIEYKLTSKESELLKLFCLNMNQVLKRQLALKTVWGDESYFSGRSMDVFISRLRKYLKSDSRIEIVNVHGQGYKLIVHE
ncbi:MAG: response regulator transcription factor [Candidatus Zixiibacteriota bacterium]